MPAPIKERQKLTPELRRLAEQAWSFVEGRARYLDKRWPTIHASGAIAERIVELIGTFSDRGSSLRVWAFRQAYFAMVEARRGIIPRGYRNYRERTLRADAPRIAQIDLIFSRYQDEKHPPTLDPVPEFETEEAARHLLRGLSRVEAAVLWGHEVEGRHLKMIAREFGLTESRASQIRSETIERLREAGRTG